MADYDEKLADALKVARLYYYQNLTTEQIAEEMNVSRSTVSRLLSYAKEQGLIEIRIIDPQAQPRRLEQEIKRRFNIANVQVISVPETTPEEKWLDRVALFTAKYLNTLLESHMILGLAWGTTLSAVTRHLIPKSTTGVQIIQLNGAGNKLGFGVAYASKIVVNFADNYQARAQLFPVPAFFDFPETKEALWRERSIRRILEMKERADILLYSIGSVNSQVPSHVYSSDYLEERDFAELEREEVVGDIATVFFRADGSYRDIPLNSRASGPDLELFQQPKRGICVVSGLGKVKGLQAALKAGFLTDLIVDDPTARLLLELPD